MKNSSQNFNSRDDKPMFDAICAECGKKCQVPFRPSGDKPVYCSDCFQNMRGSSQGQGGRRDDRRDNRRDDRRDFRREKRMFSVVCDKCGRPCQVPFQPTEGKPVYCDLCFGKGGSAPKSAPQNNEQLQMLNTKLDKIINALIEAKIMKPAKKIAPVEPAKPVKTEPVAAVKPGKEKKAPAPKAEKKKAPVAKAPAKKKTAKKK